MKKGSEEVNNYNYDELQFTIDGKPFATTDRFVVDNDSKAEWAMSKIFEARAKYDRLKNWYEEQLEGAKKECEDRVAFFSSMLADYLEKVPAHITKGGQRKYALPSGTLIQTPPSVDYIVDDEEQIKEWARKNQPGMLKIEVNISKLRLNRYIEETGEIPVGVIPTEKPGKFVVKENG